MRTSRIVIILIMFAFFLSPGFGFVFASDQADGYLIISNVSKTSLDPLIKYRESKGLNVYYVQANDIDDKISPQKIRDFLLEKKDEWNLKFLLIAGTHEKIPMLVASPDPGSTSHSMVTNTPTDYYYATPSSNWDKDGDGVFGELKDDGIASFEPEIFVGRIPFDTDEDVLKISHYISKFDSSSDAEKAKCLFPGGMLSYKGQLWEGGPMERGDGGYFSELVYTDHLKDSFSRYRMYESEGFLKSPFICEDDLTNTNLKRHFSKKYGLVCWTGHGSPDRVVRTVWNTRAGGKTIPGKDEVEEPKLLHASELKRTDINWGVVVAASCSTSNPRMRYNLGASTLRSGCISYVGSTGVAWGPSYWRKPEDGGMDTILYLFLENLKVPGTTTGEALDNALYNFSKLYFWGDTEDPPEASQMNIFNFNLYGDPAATLVSGDDSPRVIVSEPSIFVEEGGKAVWKGQVLGSIEEIQKPSVIPAIEDVSWATPKLELDSSDNSWRIEANLTDDVNIGKREWFLSYNVDGEKIIINLVLNVTKKEEGVFSYEVFPRNVAPFRPFNLNLKSESDFNTTNFMVKFNPYALELLEIKHDGVKGNGGWSYIDNHFGMAVFSSGVKGNDVFCTLSFLPKGEFESDDISFIDLAVRDSESKKVLCLPRKVKIVADQEEVSRSKADFNKSGYVDYSDITMLVLMFGCTEGQSSWNPDFDLHKDGVINTFDYSVALSLMTPESES